MSGSYFAVFGARDEFLSWPEGATGDVFDFADPGFKRGGIS